MKPLLFLLVLFSWQVTHADPVILELPDLEAGGKISPTRWESYFSKAADPKCQLAIPDEWGGGQHQAWLESVVAYNMSSYRSHLFELSEDSVDAQLTGLSRLRDQLFDDPSYHDFELGRVLNSILFEYIHQAFFKGEITPAKATLLVREYKLKASESRAFTLLKNSVEAENESELKNLPTLAAYDQMLHAALDFWIDYAKSGGKYSDMDKTALRTAVRPYYFELDGWESPPNENGLSVIINFSDGTDPFTFFTRIPRGMRDPIPPLSKTGYGNKD